MVELIYIGQSIRDCKEQGIKGRLSNHEKHSEFENSCLSGEEICYEYVHVSDTEIDRVENGLVYFFQPPLNDKLKDSYEYPDTQFNLSGKTYGISPKSFVVKDSRK